MSAIYSYDVTVVSNRNSAMTMHVKASTEAEALFQAGRQFNRVMYSEMSSRQEELLCAVITREQVSHLIVTCVD